MASSKALAEHVLLIGMMGSGKSTVGRLLARELGVEFLDSDEQVQRATGRTIPEIFSEDGEAAFRAEEKRALAEGIAAADPRVVAVAGGAVLDQGNRELIADAGLVVWLRASVDSLTKRVGRGDGRPLLGDDPAAALRRLEAERRPLYEQLADIIVDVDGLAPADVVARIAAARQ